MKREKMLNLLLSAMRNYNSSVLVIKSFLNINNKLNYAVWVHFLKLMHQNKDK